MIIGFEGTTQKRNHRAAALCAIAASSALDYRQKALILSLNDKTTHELRCEDLLVGKKIQASSVAALANTFSDTGIDALLSRVESERLTKDHFDTCCLQTINKNATLDVAAATSKLSLEEELLSKIDDIKALLDAAKNEYDCIYVLLPHNNEKLVKKLLPQMDKVVICVGQGPKEDYVAPSKKAGVVLITDYDNDSQYSTRYLSKQYPFPVYALKHNALFRDSCINLEMLNFILTNEKDEPYDDNYDFISTLKSVTNQLVGNVEPLKQKEVEYIRLKEKEAKALELKTLNQDSVKEVETKQKGFLFFKKKRTVLTVDETNNEVITPVEPITETEDMLNELEKTVITHESDMDKKPTVKKPPVKKAPVKKAPASRSASNNKKETLSDLSDNDGEAKKNTSKSGSSVKKSTTSKTTAVKTTAAKNTTTAKATAAKATSAKTTTAKTTAVKATTSKTTATTAKKTASKVAETKKVAEKKETGKATTKASPAKTTTKASASTSSGTKKATATSAAIKVAKKQTSNK